MSRKLFHLNSPLPPVSFHISSPNILKLQLVFGGAGFRRAEIPAERQYTTKKKNFFFFLLYCFKGFPYEYSQYFQALTYLTITFLGLTITFLGLTITY